MAAFSIAGLGVIVTGGTKGIGKGIARVFANAGAKVVVTGRDQGTAEACAAELGVSYFIGDVSKKADCEAMAAFALERLGGIDVLCCNAGILPNVRIQDMAESDIDLVFDVNFKGTVLCVQACLTALEASGRGRVILTSSITGPVTGFPGWSHYGASKAAQLGFMRTAALEFAPKGITVNAVLPGNITTEGLEALGPEYIASTAASIPQKRLGSVDDIGNAALFFASAAAGFVTGQTLVVDGGQTLPECPAAIL
jgi:3-oxoacyl-[acyl-carrier protein] reductase